MEKRVDAVVLGAGITGLTTSFLMQEQGKSVVLLEQADRVGGPMQTLEVNGFVFESGPNTGVVGNRSVLDLFERLAPDCLLETAKSEAKRRLIWKGDRFEALPAGLMDAIRTPLFTWKDRFRVLAEPFRRKGSNPNESVADLTRRRLGQSFLDYAVDPFVSGIYAGDPHRLLTRYALPKLYRLEQEYGSFVRGSFKRAPLIREEKRQGVSKEVFSVKDGSGRSGFGCLVACLKQRLHHEVLRLSVSSMQITPVDGRWLVELPQTGERLLADRVISTVPAYALPDVFPFISKDLLDPIASLLYAPVVQVGVGLKDDRHIPQAFGGLVPSCEGRPLLGILFPSACFSNRAGVVSFFMGGVRHPEMLSWTDAALTEVVVDALHTMLGYEPGFVPDALHIFRHARAIPQYEMGSAERLAAVDRIEAKYPGIVIGGGLRDGIGLADRIAQAYVFAGF